MRVMIATTLTPSIVSEIASDRDHHGRLVPVVRADIDPLWSVGRPHLAPAAIVGGVDEGSAKERKAIEAVMEEAVMEAVMECGACETRRDCRICKARIRKARAVELRACRAKAHSSAHCADRHCSSHAATVHSSHAPAKSASGESRCGESKCRAERPGSQAVQELAVHPNSSFIELQRRVPSQDESQVGDQTSRGFQIKKTKKYRNEKRFRI